ncbi:DUF262 domain-containing protein [Lysobacter enzymogenes]|uniref:DUF262 domain-containing protein n=1 Tax=Lysobacter enzymogenes TaxID=69 RepID=UPI001A95EE03|nr:DUF262 domain-containing protein [Lysobacter enzymogenes]QQP96727.1 DUF262 domain-containing protein [Lysobacter enzymogenes]
MSEMYAQYDKQRRKVDVDNLDVTVRELVRMVNSNEIDRAAEYQRKFRWGEDRESRLIESIILGLPVPTIFVATNKDGTWELVDGLQRVSSLVHFVTEMPHDEGYKSVGKVEPLTLCGLEQLDSFNGKTYADLPETIRLQFMKRSLRVTAISDKSDRQVRFDTFQRLNTGGIVLTSQEIRACVYRGPLIDFLEAAAADVQLRTLIKLQSGRQDDGTLEEFVLKMFAYKNYRSNFDGAVTAFLNSYSEQVATNFDALAGARLLRKVVLSLGKVISGPILKKGYSVTPLNLAEGIFVGAAELISSRKSQFKPAKNWLADKDLLKYSTKGTNTRSYLEGRIARSKELLQGAKPKV